jgi:hypothetical protein
MITILRAAIRHEGKCYSIAPPYRHHDILRMMAEIGIVGSSPDGQGFITSEYKWVDRKQAWKIAVRAGQLKQKILDDGMVITLRNSAIGILYSEDLW